MKRAQKIAILESLMQGNAAPIVQHKQDLYAPMLYWVNARKKGNNEGFTDIELTENRTGSPNECKQLTDMSEQGFNNWISQLRTLVTPVICIIRPE